MSESERYARLKLHYGFNVSPVKLDVFFETILLSGYFSLLQERLYWCNDKDVSNDLIKRKISTNRFHLADNNNLTKSDKLAKVKPYLNLMQRNFA